MTDPITSSDISALRSHGSAFNGPDNADKYWQGVMYRVADALELLVQYRDMLARQGTERWEAQLVALDLAQVVAHEGAPIVAIPRIDLRKEDGTYKTMEELRAEAKVLNESES